MAGTVTDPVCGMLIDPADSEGSADYEGQTYYFCSAGCMGAFSNDPGRYAATAPRP
jgi:YHS domain-containing protein